jgi:hypothetical protein
MKSTPSTVEASAITFVSFTFNMKIPCHTVGANASDGLSVILTSAFSGSRNRHPFPANLITTPSGRFNS